MSVRNSYTHIKKYEREVLEQLKRGSTQREVAEYFGFRDKYVVKPTVTAVFISG